MSPVLSSGIQNWRGEQEETYERDLNLGITEGLVMNAVNLLNAPSFLCKDNILCCTVIPIRMLVGKV